MMQVLYNFPGDACSVCRTGNDNIQPLFRTMVGQQRKIIRRPLPPGAARTGMNEYITAWIQRQLQSLELLLIPGGQWKFKLVARQRYAQMRHQRLMTFDLMNAFRISDKLG